ncbi:MAG TPA: endolytic transglycosylase MltG [Patescibacteria group bacterium]|nr:endolytic transglycosylase MltG [Patescibacteria group bacterium]
MKRFITSLCLLLIILAAAGALWWINGVSAVSGKDAAQKVFVVDRGESTRQIGLDLKNAGLIRDPWVFYLLVKLTGNDGKIQAGDFRLNSSQTPQQIIATMTKGTLDIWVTIPEGKRATEIAEILQKNLPSYDSSWEEKLATQEGYLFPDTYLFPHDTTINQVISIMENNFKAKYAQAQQTQTNKLTQADAVTLASIVEREAISPHDMQYVASTLENRLRIGMALGSDVTIEYALGKQPNGSWWKQDLTMTDLASNSPYNTRKFAGLPPTPISNPGLVALQAVLNPPASNYLYYISDSKGVLHFAQTLDEHNANIRKYGE